MILNKMKDISITINIYVYSKYIGEENVINMFLQMYKSVEELLGDEYYINILEKILDNCLEKPKIAPVV